MSLTTEAMVAALEPIIDDVTARYDAPTEFVLPGENRVAAALDVAAHGRAARRAPRGRRRRRRLARRQPGRAVPQPPRRPRVHARPLAGGHVPSRPHRPQHLNAIRHSIPTPDPPEPPCPSRSPSSPRPPTASRPSCSPSRSARAPAFGPGADAVDAALGGGLARVPRRGRLRGQARRDARGADRGQAAGEGRDPRGRSAIPAELTVDGVRRAAAAVARRASKAASVATTLATAGTELDVADAAQAVAEGFVLGAYQYLEYKGDATPSKLKKVTVIADGGAAGARRGRAGRDGRRRGHVGARHGEHAVEGEVARRHGRRRRASCCAGAASPCRCSTSSSSQAQRMGGVLGVGQGSEQAPRFLKMTYAPSGRARQAARARRQGRGVRLRWPVAQDRRRHGDDEDRHVGRRGGDRGDVDAGRRSA